MLHIKIIQIIYVITKKADQVIVSNIYQLNSVNIDSIISQKANKPMILGIFSNLKSIVKTIITTIANKVIKNDILDISQKIKNANIIERILFILVYGIKVEIFSIEYMYWFKSVFRVHTIVIKTNNQI